MTKRTPRTEEVLRYARNLLIEKGWCQGWSAKIGNNLTGYEDKKATHFCSYGAITKAYRELGASGKIFEKAQIKFEKLNKIKDSIVRWNDTPKRTKEQVLAAFDKAIKG